MQVDDRRYASALLSVNSLPQISLPLLKIQISNKMLSIRPWLMIAFFNAVVTQTTSSNVELFIHNMDPGAAWAASIQNACNGSTTYVVSCTSAPLNNACSPEVNLQPLPQTAPTNPALDGHHYRRLRLLHRNHTGNLQRDISDHD